MKYRTISKYLVILATLLLGATVFIGCSDEEKETGGGSFFKISITEEAFGNTDLTRAITEVQADTVITPIDDDLYMETILSSDHADSGVTRASSAPSTNVKSGTAVTVLAYSGDTYVGQITGTVGDNGSVTMADNQLALGPGTYTFVCLANVDIDSGHRFFKAKKGSNSMAGTVSRTINAGDKDCKLTFVLQHKVGQIRITVRTESDTFNGLTATLNSSAQWCPTTQEIALPSTIDVSGGHGGYETMNDTFFSNVSGTIEESKDENYYIGGYFYTALSTFSLNVTSGTIGGRSIAGTSVNFSNFDVQQNKISRVTITFRRQSLNYLFDATPNAVSVPAAGGDIAFQTDPITVTSTLNGSSQGWGIENLSTAPLTETGGTTTDAHDSGVVTSYSPQTYIGTNGGSPSIVLSANTSTSPRTVYVRLKQEDSGKTILLTIMQPGVTQQRYEVVMGTEAYGSISNNGSFTNATGSISSTAMPNDGYDFDAWYKDNVPIENEGDYYVSENGRTLTVKFNANGAGKYIARYKIGSARPPSYTLYFYNWDSEERQQSLSADDARALLNTPGGILYDPYGPTWHNDKAKSSNGWFVLKREYWTGSSTVQTTYRTGQATAATHNDSRYWWIPNLGVMQRVSQDNFVWTPNSGGVIGYVYLRDYDPITTNGRALMFDDNYNAQIIAISSKETEYRSFWPI